MDSGEYVDSKSALKMALESQSPPKLWFAIVGELVTQGHLSKFQGQDMRLMWGPHQDTNKLGPSGSPPEVVVLPPALELTPDEKECDAAVAEFTQTVASYPIGETKDFLLHAISRVSIYGADEKKIRAAIFKGWSDWKFPPSAQLTACPAPALLRWFFLELKRAHLPVEEAAPEMVTLPPDYVKAVKEMTEDVFYPWLESVGLALPEKDAYQDITKDRESVVRVLSMGRSGSWTPLTTFPRSRSQRWNAPA